MRKQNESRECCFRIYSYPFGSLRIEACGPAITAISWTAQPGEGHECETEPIRNAAEQLNAYFAGKLREFDLPLAPEGTPFQLKVWEALNTIPYGKTRTYGDVARMIGNSRACRAVGMANHRNPIAIVIPCHRVIGADASLTGYASGLELKRMLLELERGERVLLP